MRSTVGKALDMDEQWGRRVLEIIPRSPQVYLPSLDFEGGFCSASSQPGVRVA